MRGILAERAAAMREKRTRGQSKRKLPPPMTAYDRGLLDGARNYQRPSANYVTAADLCAWWRGWKAGRRPQINPIQSLLAAPKRRETKESPDERRAVYLAEKLW